MAGMARFAMSRPGLPKMSPMNRSRTSVGPYRNAMLPAAPFFDSRQCHAQLAGSERRVGTRHVEGAGEADRTRKTSKHALGDMKGGVAVRFAPGGALHARDHQRVASDHDLHRVRFHAR